MTSTPDVDRMVSEAVRNIRDRFGVAGLRDLVTVATAELQKAEVAADELAASASDQADMGDTQAWMAFTGDEFNR